ncbi:XRE family transcriptional regulator [Ralstonia sp. Ralssp135]|uniref:XRE family transcriptional regulator n=1 Tax=Ralstonia sp. Ralssp135 TaxID=3243016 RepID=UPI0039B099F7
MQMNELPSGRFPAGFAVPPATQGEPKRRFLPDGEIAKCQTFRQACALAWKHRVLPGMTLQMLAALADLQHQHVSDYFHPEPVNSKGNARRSLPAEKIDEVERVLGNHVLTQFLVWRAQMTLMEAVLAARNA